VPAARATAQRGPCRRLDQFRRLPWMPAV